MVLVSNFARYPPWHRRPADPVLPADLPDGLVRAEPSGYALTTLGLSLLAPLEAMRTWGRRNMPAGEAARLAHDGDDTTTLRETM
jgi:hypothetical protein